MPVDALSEHFDPTMGRPTKELYSIAGLLLIQEFMDWTKDEALDAYSFSMTRFLQLLVIIDGLLSSCARFAQKLSVLDAHKRGQLPPAETIKMGPPKVFGRLWQQLGIKKIVKELLGNRVAT